MLSRREFLRNLATTAIALSLDPFMGVAIAGNKYINNRLGLSVQLPDNWEFGSIADFVAIRERTALIDDIAYETEAHPLKDPTNLPIFLFENPAFKREEFVPAIAMYDEPLNKKTPIDQVFAHQHMLNNLGGSYRDMQVIESPSPVHISGVNGTWSKWSYLHELDDGSTYAVSVQSLLIFRSPRVHTFYLVDDLNSPCIEEQVWTNYINSISYA